MSLEACARIVEAGDPARFRATMAASPVLRETLFPLYAFNVEVARAPWVTQEPMIGEMRLQWWRDVLEEIAEGGPVRSHEVSTPLAEVLDSEAARALDRGIEARRWDLYREPFEDEPAFWQYLRDTSGVLLREGARLVGAPASSFARIEDFGTAMGLANWLLAIPALEKAGRLPLVDGRAEAILDLAKEGLALAKPPKLPQPTRGVLLAAWQTRTILDAAARDPSRVAGGTLEPGPFATSLRLGRAALFGL